MKTKGFLLAILGLGFIFTSCEKDDFNVVPSAKVTTTKFTASNIRQLDVSDVFNVYVSFSETEESVLVEANENIHHLIEMSQTGDKLIVGLHKNTNISGAPVLNVYVKTSSIEHVKAEGATMVEFQNQMEGNRLDIEITGASTFQGSINVDELVSKLYGAGKMEIRGTANSFEIVAEGASTMTDFDFVTKYLKANLYGGSNISLTIAQKLEVTASGASNVYYKGSGLVEKQNLKDASKIVKVD